MQSDKRKNMFFVIGLVASSVYYVKKAKEYVEIGKNIVETFKTINANEVRNFDSSKYVLKKRRINKKPNNLINTNKQNNYSSLDKNNYVNKEKPKEEFSETIIKDSSFNDLTEEDLKTFKEIWYEDSQIKIESLNDDDLFKAVPKQEGEESFDNVTEEFNNFINTDNKILENDDNITKLSPNNDDQKLPERDMETYLAELLTSEGYINIKEKGFFSPEDAIVYFFNSLREENIFNALQCFATTSYVNNIKFVDNIVQDKWDYYPSEYDLFYKSNWIKVVNEKANNVLGFIINLMLEENDLITGLGARKERSLGLKEEDALKIFKSLDTKDLNSFYIISIDLPNPNLMDDDETKESLKEEAINIGGIDKTERVILFSYNNRTYFVCFTLVQYEDGWKIEKFGSEVALNTPSNFNTPYKVNDKEYYALTV